MKEKGSKNAQIRLIRALLCNKLDYSWLLQKNGEDTKYLTPANDIFQVGKA
jgi:hypothetical protein